MNKMFSHLKICWLGTLLLLAGHLGAMSSKPQNLSRNQEKRNVSSSPEGYFVDDRGLSYSKLSGENKRIASSRSSRQVSVELKNKKNIKMRRGSQFQIPHSKSYAIELLRLTLDKELEEEVPNLEGFTFFSPSSAEAPSSFVFPKPVFLEDGPLLSEDGEIIAMIILGNDEEFQGRRVVYFKGGELLNSLPNSTVEEAGPFIDEKAPLFLSADGKYLSFAVWISKGASKKLGLSTMVVNTENAKSIVDDKYFVATSVEGSVMKGRLVSDHRQEITLNLRDLE